MSGEKPVCQSESLLIGLDRDIGVEAGISEVSQRDRVGHTGTGSRRGVCVMGKSHRVIREELDMVVVFRPFGDATSGLAPALSTVTIQKQRVKGLREATVRDGSSTTLDILGTVTVRNGGKKRRKYIQAKQPGETLSHVVRSHITNYFITHRRILSSLTSATRDA